MSGQFASSLLRMQHVAGSVSADMDSVRKGGKGRTEAQHLSGFAPDREARGQPRVTVAGGPGGSHWVWRGGPPKRAHGRRIVESNCTTLIMKGPRRKLLR